MWAIRYHTHGQCQQMQADDVNTKLEGLTNVIGLIKVQPSVISFSERLAVCGKRDG